MVTTIATWRPRHGTGTGVDPTDYAGVDNVVGIYGTTEESAENLLIDVSKHQENIDWNKVPYRALVRIGYRGYGSGQLCKDECFDANLAGAKAAEKLMGFYFFSQAINEAEAQARRPNFARPLHLQVIRCFSILNGSHKEAHDGRADSLKYTQRTACARAFCERAEALGFQAGHYHFYVFCLCKR